MACAGKEWMDCTPHGADKKSAVAFLQEYLGITPEETCTLGDNINDIEMLKSAGVSYAVANAREEVDVYKRQPLILRNGNFSLSFITCASVSSSIPNWFPLVRRIYTCTTSVSYTHLVYNRIIKWLNSKKVSCCK